MRRVIIKYDSARRRELKTTIIVSAPIVCGSMRIIDTILHLIRVQIGHQWEFGAVLERALKSLHSRRATIERGLKDEGTPHEEIVITKYFKNEPTDDDDDDDGARKEKVPRLPVR